VNRKSISESVPVLGSSHPHPNHVKGVFSALHFFHVQNRPVFGEIGRGGKVANYSQCEECGFADG